MLRSEVFLLAPRMSANSGEVSMSLLNSAIKKVTGLFLCKVTIGYS